ncbi:hypothetical protein GJAV_G00072890 [Gymnothorax javanicus]|nr:hypothetical protein GJAV_G00072890 [Gymnothorax javanicus]
MTPGPLPPKTGMGLRKLAALWPRLTLSPISGGAWAHLMQAFVSDTSRSVPPPDPMPGRVAADRLNAARISAITGVGPAFLDLPLQRLSDSDSTHTMPTGRSLTLVPPPHHHSHPLICKAHPCMASPPA